MPKRNLRTKIGLSWTLSNVILPAIAAMNWILLSAAAGHQPPTILDTDYGSFIDDIFAVGLLLQSTDVLDTRLILTTSEEPEWSANCVSEQISRSDLGFDVPVAIGETLPPYSERGTVCGVPGLIGFALFDTCAELKPQQGVGLPPPPIPNGVAHAAKLLDESDRTDWTYIAIGGQTSLRKLIRDHPAAISKIQNLVIMGGNWCTGFEAYPGVPTPTAETNIGCDMAAANFVLEAAAEATLQQRHFPEIHYVPVSTVNVLSGDDYALITEAATATISHSNSNSISINSHNNHNPHYSKAAHATIDFYNAWSASARASPSLLVYKEAMTFDPSTESTPQFDAVAVLVAMDIARGASGARVAQHEFANGVHFVTNQEAELASEHPDFFRGTPAPAAYTLWSGDEASINDKVGGGRNNGMDSNISDRCQDLTPYHFDPSLRPPISSSEEEEGQPKRPPTPPVRIRAALGFVSQDTEQDFFHEMALRISGRWTRLISKASVATSRKLSVPVSISASRASVAAVAVVALDPPRRVEQNISEAATSLLPESSCSKNTIEEYSEVV